MNQFKRGGVAPHFTATKVRMSTGTVSRLVRTYEKTVTYYNGLNDPVTIVERSGLNIVVPPLRLREFNEFVVRVTYSIPKSVNFDSKNLLSVDSDKSDLRVLKKAEDLRLNSDQYEIGVISQIDYAFDNKDLASRGGSLYVDELDVVLSFHLGNDVPLHPASIEGQKRLLAIEQESYVKNNCFGVSIQIVDNYKRFGERFINFNGLVYKVPAVKNHSVKDGVYFVSTKDVTGDYDCQQTNEEFLSFENADKALNMYRTVDEALSFGDALGNFERKIELEKLERKQIENQLDKEKMLRNAEANELDRLRKMEEGYMKLITTQRSYEYDSRAASRKESFEILKFLPHILIAVSSVAATLAYKK